MRQTPGDRLEQLEKKGYAFPTYIQPDETLRTYPTVGDTLRPICDHIHLTVEDALDCAEQHAAAAAST